MHLATAVPRNAGLLHQRVSNADSVSLARGNCAADGRRPRPSRLLRRELLCCARSLAAVYILWCSCDSVLACSHAPDVPSCHSGSNLLYNGSRDAGFLVVQLVAQLVSHRKAYSSFLQPCDLSPQSGMQHWARCLWCFRHYGLCVPVNEEMRHVCLWRACRSCLVGVLLSSAVANARAVPTVGLAWHRSFLGNCSMLPLPCEALCAATPRRADMET